MNADADRDVVYLIVNIYGQIHTIGPLLHDNAITAFESIKLALQSGQDCLVNIGTADEPFLLRTRAIDYFRLVSTDDMAYEDEDDANADVD